MPAVLLFITRYRLFLATSIFFSNHETDYLYKDFYNRSTNDPHTFFSSFQSLSAVGREHCASTARYKHRAHEGERPSLVHGVVSIFFHSTPALFFSSRYIMYALDARVAFRSGVVRVRPLVPRVINNLETWISQGTARHPRRLVRVILFFSFFFSLASHAAEIVGVTARNTYACKRVSLVIRSLAFLFLEPRLLLPFLF